MNNNYDGLGLFSGGLDGLLAIKLLEEQGLKIKPLHFFSPFFGYPQKRTFWKRTYNLDVHIVDVSDDFISMLAGGPKYSVGSAINPCVDCKILLLAHARKLLPRFGAKFIATGEVIGQRPMSQRRDTLNIISRDAEIRSVLLRPLCAKCLPPTTVEESGLVDRERLECFSGRGRKEQFALARRLGIENIPTPAGGCLLTEKENARRFWPVLKYIAKPTKEDFYLVNTGRQFFCEAALFAIGRQERDNKTLLAFAKSGDVVLKLRDFPGPIGLIRIMSGGGLLQSQIEEAAALLSSFSPRAKVCEESVVVLANHIAADGFNCDWSDNWANTWPDSTEITVTPKRETIWLELDWKEAKEEINQRFRVT